MRFLSLAVTTALVGLMACGESHELDLATETAALDSRVIQWNPNAGAQDYVVSRIIDQTYSGETITVNLNGSPDVAVSGSSETLAAAYSFHFVRLVDPNPNNFPVQLNVAAIQLPDLPQQPVVGATHTWIGDSETSDSTVIQVRTRNTVTITGVTGPLIRYKVATSYRVTDNDAWQAFSQVHLAGQPTDWLTGSWTLYKVTTGTFDSSRGLLVRSDATSIWPSFPGATENDVLTNADRRVESVQLTTGQGA